MAYKRQFEALLNAGVPAWYIRKYALTELIYSSKIYIFYVPNAIVGQGAWYSVNGLGISSNPQQEIKVKGTLTSMGFPLYEEYSLLYEGDEYETEREYQFGYEDHRKAWLEEREKESKIHY